MGWWKFLFRASRVDMLECTPGVQPCAFGECNYASEKQSRLWRDFVRRGIGHGACRAASVVAPVARRGRAGAGVSQPGTARKTYGDAQSLAVHQRQRTRRVHPRSAREENPLPATLLLPL